MSARVSVWPELERPITQEAGVRWHGLSTPDATGISFSLLLPLLIGDSQGALYARHN
jgi:hypothetical protein